MKSILTGMIGGGVTLLHGRRGFFFEPNNGDVSSGAASNQAQNQNPGNGQQNGEAATPNPFAGIDKAMLDDATRAQIEKAEQEFATVANQAKQAPKFQSEYDKLKAQHDALQAQVNQSRSNTPPQNMPGNQPAQKSLRDEIYDEYIANQIPPEQAAKLADMNAKFHEKNNQRLMASLGTAMGPIVDQVSGNAASQAFQSVMQNDTLGIQDLPDVKERVWQQTQALAQGGQVVDAKVVQNLARIYWAEHVEQNGMPNSPTQMNNPIAPVPSFQPASPISQQTRYTFPGAGSNLRPQNSSRQSSPLDPETRAALAATMAGWPIKPKDGQIH